MTKILNTTTLTFLQETTFIFYTIAFGWITTTNSYRYNVVMVKTTTYANIALI